MATSGDSDCNKNERDSDCDKNENAKVVYKPVEEVCEMADLLRLLQPVESSWKPLGRYLLKDELQYKLKAIEADSFHNDASKKALDDVLEKWLECTVSENRIWQTLCDAAEKNEDDSLKEYVKANNLKKNGEPTMRLLQRWSKEAPTRTSWYNFAVKLVGKPKAEIIRTTYFGGGHHSCLQRMLVTWYDSSTDHSWQVIVNALKELDNIPASVIKSIKDHCLKKK